jgi:hypothetical protein
VEVSERSIARPEVAGSRSGAPARVPAWPGAAGGRARTLACALAGGAEAGLRPSGSACVRPSGSACVRPRASACVRPRTEGAGSPACAAGWGEGVAAWARSRAPGRGEEPDPLEVPDAPEAADVRGADLSDLVPDDVRGAGLLDLGPDLAERVVRGRPSAASPPSRPPVSLVVSQPAASRAARASAPAVPRLAPARAGRRGGVPMFMPFPLRAPPPVRPPERRPRRGGRDRTNGLDYR